MDIEVTFLGTGSHTPTPKRNHTGILFSFNSNNILIDCGEGIQRQYKISKHNPCKLTHLLITHWHGDHVLGIPGLLQTLAMAEYSKTLEIYGPVGTKRKFELLEKLYSRFKIKYNIHEVTSGKILEKKEYYIKTSPMKHGSPSQAYSITIKDKLRLDKNKIKKLKLPNAPILGKLQQGKDVSFQGKKIKSKSVTYLEKGKKISVIMDTLPNKNADKIAKSSDILICESSFHSNEKEKAISHKHLTAKQAATIAKKANVKKLFITHISHRYSQNTHPLLDEAKKTFSKTFLPKDFDKIKI
jgi:ribonuclease Z